MHLKLLLVLAVLLGAPASASAETARQMLQQFGLIGTWAANCNRPPADENIHTVYASLPNDNVQRTYYSAPGKITSKSVLERVKVISSDQLSYRQKNSQGYLDIILKKTGNFIRVLSSQNENGTIYVQGGKFTAKVGTGSSAGKESPLQTKCHS